MTDILIREIDDAIAERLRQVAVERNWPVNQVIVHALRYALGLGGEDLVRRDRQDIAHLRGTWNTGETAAFREALSAFDTYDLAKLLSAVTGQPIAERLLSVMTEARKKEVSWVMRREVKIDPIEVAEIEERFLETVRAIKSPPGTSAPHSNLDV